MLEAAGYAVRSELNCPAGGTRYQQVLLPILLYCLRATTKYLTAYITLGIPSEKLRLNLDVSLLVTLNMYVPKYLPAEQTWPERGRTIDFFFGNLLSMHAFAGNAMKLLQ